MELARLVMAGVGVSVQGARTAVDVSGAVASQARERVASETGVNLDEEAANLVRYQQAYQAAAQVIATANTLFDTLLAATRR